MEITGFGDQVKINAVGDITVSNYAPNVTTVTPQQLRSEQTVLLIDQSKYFAFYIDDVDAAQVKPKLMNEAMRKAAYALADDSDSYIGSLYSQAGATVTSTAVTIATAMTILSNTAKTLDQNNVPSQGRWMAIPAWYHQKLILNGLTVIDGNVDITDTYRNGFLGRAFGFDIFLSNNLSTGVGTVANQSHYALAGTDRAISYANQIVKTEAYRPEDSFSDAVKGLHVYGAKVIDPKALVQLNIATAS